jgi:5-formyltetrahydrofolate cyclo-ligase
MSILEEKALLRQEAGARRDAFAGSGAGAAITEADLQLPGMAAGQAVSGYNPFGSEADCLPLLTRLAERGHVTALPVMQGRSKPLAFRRWRVGGELVPGSFNIPVPPPEAGEVDPGILIVPLLAFDRAGYRLGYGGGYYDRTLAALRARHEIIAVGLAFSIQEVADVPRTERDERLDYVLTERELIAMEKD